VTALPLPPGFDARSLRAAGTTVVLVVLLAALGGVSLPVAAGLSVAAAVVSLWWRGRPEPRAAEYGLAPAVVATGAVAVFSSPSILIGALAGAAGLALLLWNAESPGDLVRGSDPFPGLLLPGLGLGIALLAAVALPSAPAAVGAAGVAVVIAFGFVVWALGEAWRAPPVPAKAL
jgi:hypothetical protein